MLRQQWQILLDDAAAVRDEGAALQHARLVQHADRRTATALQA
ncbi:hypothetical protein [Streptomyces himalayensis]|nr:hypothetical protein [Streptomyces himalayensis]